MSEVAQLISQTLEQERRQRELLERHYAQYDADDDEVGTTTVSSWMSHHVAPVSGSLQFPKEDVIYIELKFDLLEKKYHLYLIVSYKLIHGVWNTVKAKQS